MKIENMFYLNNELFNKMYRESFRYGGQALYQLFVRTINERRLIEPANLIVVPDDAFEP